MICLCIFLCVYLFICLQLERCQEETEHLEEARRHLEYAHSQSKRPLQVSHQNDNDHNDDYMMMIQRCVHIMCSVADFKFYECQSVSLANNSTDWGRCNLPCFVWGSGLQVNVECMNARENRVGIDQVWYWHFHPTNLGSPCCPPLLVYLCRNISIKNPTDSVKIVQKQKVVVCATRFMIWYCAISLHQYHRTINQVFNMKMKTIFYRWRIELTRTWWRRMTTSGNTCSRSRLTVHRRFWEIQKEDHDCKHNLSGMNVQVLLEKVDRTLEASRQAQEALNRDLDMKDVAFGIDQTCLVLWITWTIWDR